MTLERRSHDADCTMLEMQRRGFVAETGGMISKSNSKMLNGKNAECPDNDGMCADSEWKGGAKEKKKERLVFELQACDCASCLAADFVEAG